MKVLVIGAGAREHAIIDSLLADASVTSVIAAPGNAGMAAVVETRPIDVNDPEAVGALAADLTADLVVIGPEVPLVAGAADAVRSRGIACFGPSAEAAQLEGSKAFAKQVMAEADVPTAMSYVCSSVEQVEDALGQFGSPYVVKDDGLAAGKGVVVTSDRDAAVAHARECLAKGSDARVVIEEFLDGPEVSLFAITDGVTVLPLQPAQDFKRAGDGDSGPNTGGMGAYSPLPWAPSGLVADITERVLQPMVDAMRRRGTPFSGLLYAGLAMTSRGVRVIEFNARFGDPETQVVLANLRTPLGQVLLAAAQGKLADLPPLTWEPGFAVTVVVASEGYPASPRTGDAITGLADAADVAGVKVFHAGTTIRDDGAVASAGGRVLSVTAHGESLAQARERAYVAVDLISLEGSHHRRDIAEQAAADSVGG
ncbi:MAG: phosphoribosylamine--glycine ligase [Candidatus Nanopelagicales bacterium]|nr:phosphoribosylamine--glycine ligase [Candidatus Nanopelagicales bacterium]MCF8537366.1 phosphoribosylamine--glycine ligase [Candidatus Nanopelagicales bacterium]MCF8543217.1 phosphoribosylamine--glycine ligase [Candidatus Nanopelagicales bacterium]MCF8557814.1 phosphoribosylamine--glycine ligase [Candidatus Nanopelagicales bacterium]